MAFKVKYVIPVSRSLLGAFGRLVVVHGQLEYELRLTLKSLKSQKILEALNETNRTQISKLKRLIKAEGRKRGLEAETISEIDGYLDRSNSITEFRNNLVHGLWCQLPNGQLAIIKDGKIHDLPNMSKINAQTLSASSILRDLNDSRLRGRINKALR